MPVDACVRVRRPDKPCDGQIVRPVNKQAITVSGGRSGDLLAHHAVAHALGPDVAEAGLLEEAPGAVVEERADIFLPSVSCGYASTTPPPACAIRSRAPRSATAVTPLRRYPLSTKKQVIR